MRDHLKEIVHSAISKVSMGPDDVVVDIGSNDATLLNNYHSYVRRVGFDPVPKFAKHYKDITFINDYFSAEKYPFKEKAKIITAISMFYDLDDPNAFVKDLAAILHEDGVLVIQQNYVVGMLQQHAFDNIVHEHLEYYSLTSLEHLLRRHGLEVKDVEMNELNGGSFRVYVKHMDNVRKLRLLEQKMNLGSKWPYYLFAMKVKHTCKKLHDFVEKQVKAGKKVYVYGASTRGSTLLQSAKLDHTLIVAAVERNPDKFGKIMASTGIPIISEEQARKDKPDYFLVLPWFFKDEFIEREKEYLSAGGHLIFPLPEFEVV